MLAVLWFIFIITVEKNELCGACGAYGREEWLFGGET